MICRDSRQDVVIEGFEDYDMMLYYIVYIIIPDCYLIIWNTSFQILQLQVELTTALYHISNIYKLEPFGMCYKKQG